MKWTKAIITGLLMGGVFTVGMVSGMKLPDAEAAQASAARVYELRTYHTNDGKLDALHNRFSNHTNQLFVRHNMTLIGYWTPADGDAAENTLTYIIGHESRDAAKENWKGFINDPDWKAAYAASIKDGKLVKKIDSTYLNPTDYSPLR